MKEEKWCVHRHQYSDVLVECSGCGVELLVLVGNGLGPGLVAPAVFCDLLQRLGGAANDDEQLFLFLLLLPLFLVLALVGVEGGGQQPFGAELTLKARNTSSRTLSCTLIPVMQIFHTLQMLAG